MFKNHLEMIGRNETASKKAKFWQSYVRSLKGSEDIKAADRRPARHNSIFPELVSWNPYHKSIYDNPSHAAERVNIPGYRYLPIHRETYGYSPRPIYATDYPRSIERYRPIYHVPTRRPRVDPYDAHKAWQDHLDRLASLDKLYPSRYGLYLKDRAYPITDLGATGSHTPLSLKGLEYEPDNKPHHHYSGPRWGSAKSYPFMAIGNEWAGIDRAIRGAAFSEPPSYVDWVSTDRSLRGKSPTPVKLRISPPRESEVAFDQDGAPIYSAGGLKRRPWASLLNPSPYLPISAITRDPFWWDYPELRPFSPSRAGSPFYVRDSYLSPVKRTYLWDKHPIRPLDLALDDLLTTDELSRIQPYLRNI